MGSQMSLRRASARLARSGTKVSAWFDEPFLSSGKLIHFFGPAIQTIDHRLGLSRDTSVARRKISRRLNQIRQALANRTGGNLAELLLRFVGFHGQSVVDDV